MFESLRKYALLEFRHLGKGVCLITIEIRPSLIRRFRGERARRATYRGSAADWVDLRTEMPPGEDARAFLMGVWREQLIAESESGARG